MLFFWRPNPLPMEAQFFALGRSILCSWRSKQPEVTPAGPHRGTTLQAPGLWEDLWRLLQPGHPPFLIHKGERLYEYYPDYGEEQGACVGGDVLRMVGS